MSDLLGDRLREERQRLGLSQDAMAQAAGVRREMWTRYEKGSDPGASVLVAASRAGMDVRYVITGSRDYVPPPPLTAEEQTLLDRWRDASREVKNAAMGALLGGSARKGASQTFMGPVGNITQGSAPVHRVEVHMAPGQYTPKRPARKRAGKP